MPQVLLRSHWNECLACAPDHSGPVLADVECSRLACVLENFSGPVLVDGLESLDLLFDGGQVPSVTDIILCDVVHMASVSEVLDNDASTKNLVVEELPSDEVCIGLDVLSDDSVPAKLTRAGMGKIVIDSGAGESVMAWQVPPQEPLKESKRANATYRDASGNAMPNKGQKQVKMIVNGKVASMVFQATDVRKPLASVSRIVEKGNTVVFDSDKSYILHKASGTKTPIDLENGAYVINVEYLIPAREDADGASLRGPGFHRPA